MWSSTVHSHPLLCGVLLYCSHPLLCGVLLYTVTHSCVEFYTVLQSPTPVWSSTVHSHPLLCGVLLYCSHPLLCGVLLYTVTHSCVEFYCTVVTHSCVEFYDTQSPTPVWSSTIHSHPLLCGVLLYCSHPLLCGVLRYTVTHSCVEFYCTAVTHLLMHAWTSRCMHGSVVVCKHRQVDVHMQMYTNGCMQFSRCIRRPVDAQYTVCMCT